MRRLRTLGGASGAVVFRRRSRRGQVCVAHRAALPARLRGVLPFAGNRSDRARRAAAGAGPGGAGRGRSRGRPFARADRARLPLLRRSGRRRRALFGVSEAPAAVPHPKGARRGGGPGGETSAVCGIRVAHAGNRPRPWHRALADPRSGAVSGGQSAAGGDAGARGPVSPHFSLGCGASPWLAAPGLVPALVARHSVLPGAAAKSPIAFPVLRFPPTC